jgi:hypothetical protein
MMTVSASTKDQDPEAPLLETGPKEPLRPLPIRAVHAGLQFVFILFGKEYGWAGFCFLVMATACSVAVSVHVNWLAGCATMMVFFASLFCFAGFQAVSGRYELARPLMLSAMMMFLSCILGGHFFVVWSKSATSQVIKDVPLAELSKVSHGYHENALFYFEDGEVSTGQMGQFKLCKDKLPVVGTCVYNYYCVAPVLANGYSQGATAYAWVGILSHTACDTTAFENSAARVAWNHPYRAGLGIPRSRYWDDAIDAAAKKYGLVTSNSAPLITWTEDPTLDEVQAWHTGWLVEFSVFVLYLIIMAIYSYCVGMAEGALPEARKIMDPEAPAKPSRRKKADS